MPAFGAASRAALAGAHPDLQRLFAVVIKYRDCTIVCGHRTAAEQLRLWKLGRNAAGEIVDKSQVVTWTLHSKHTELPARAVDVYPYPAVFDATVEDQAVFAGFVLGVAEMMGIRIRWGHDWDRDNTTADEKTTDRPHFELA